MLVQAVAHLRVGGGICRDILQHNMAGWDIVSILWTIFQAGRQVYIRSLLAPRRGKNLSCRFFDVWYGEFIKEDARQKASRFNSISYPAWGQNVAYANQSSESPDIHSLIDQQERVQVVGYSGHICEECLQIYLLSFTNKFKPQVINHKCILENLVKALILSEKQKSDKLREGHIQIPLHIRDHIIHNSKDGLIFLNAIRDPSDMRSNKIKSIPPNQYDWSSRAIKGGCTTIDHKELTEFLIQANPFSFGVFNLSDGETPVYYLMVVSDTPII